MVLRWLTSTKCSIDFTLEDNRHALAQLLIRMRPILSLPAGESWELDLSKCKFIGPYAATILVAIWLRAKGLNQKPRIIFQEHNGELHRFLEYSGMKLLMGTSPLPVGAPVAIAEKTLPLHILKDAPYNAPQPVLDLVKRHVEMTDEREEQLRTCIMEVVQNVEDHAESPIGAVICARFVECHSLIRVAIVDAGRGIFTTLSEAIPDTVNVEMALNRVIKGDYSAKSRVNNMGQGMSTLWSLVSKQMDGQIFIVTDDGIAYNKRLWPQHRKLDFRFPGTGVFFSVPVTDKKTVELV